MVQAQHQRNYAQLLRLSRFVLLVPIVLLFCFNFFAEKMAMLMIPGSIIATTVATAVASRPR